MTDITTISDEQFEYILVKLFPEWAKNHLPDKSVWYRFPEKDKVLPHHALLVTCIRSYSYATLFIIVYPQEGEAWVMNSEDDFRQLIAMEKLDIANDLQIVLDIFCLFDRTTRSVVSHVIDIEDRVMPKDLPRLLKYQDLITPPVIQSIARSKTVRFWTIEGIHGQLQEWLFTQSDDKLGIERWVLENNLVVNLGGIL
jgi:hypothetical protein